MVSPKKDGKSFLKSFTDRFKEALEPSAEDMVAEDNKAIREERQRLREAEKQLKEAERLFFFSVSEFLL